MDTSDFSVEVAPVDLAPGELGLLASRDLEPGDILVWAPTNLLLRKEVALELWGRDVENVTDRLCIALVLIHERFVRGEESKWRIYHQALPAFDGDVSGPSFLWDEEDWEFLLGSDGYDASIQMYNTLVDEYEDLRASLFSQRPEDFPTEAFTFENFLWAVAVVASRAYGDDTDGNRLCIAPLVDFVNHQEGALQLTRFSNGIVAYAHTHFQAGQQVFVNYGGKANAMLLTQYGFIIDCNRDEVVYLRMGQHLNLGGPQLEAKRRLIEELTGKERPPEEAIFRVARRPREWQAEVLPAARILALGDDASAPDSVSDVRGAQDPAHEAAAWALLEEAFDRRAAEFPLSLEEQRQRLLADNLAERESLGLRLCLSELELLAEAKVHAAEQREALEKMISSSQVAA